MTEVQDWCADGASREHQEGAYVASVERRVAAFAEDCQAFCRSIQRGTAGRAEGAFSGQRRRIKPTLISSFGLSVSARFSHDEKENRFHGSEEHERRRRRDQNHKHQHTIAPSDAKCPLPNSPQPRNGCPQPTTTLAEAWEEVYTLIADIAVGAGGGEDGRGDCRAKGGFDAGGLGSHMLFLRLATTCLRVSHMVLECDYAVGMALLRESRELQRGLLLACELAQSASHAILKIAVSHLSALEQNHLFRKMFSEPIIELKCELLRRSTVTGESEESLDLDAVPLAYNDRRDSRNRTDRRDSQGFADGRIPPSRSDGQLLHANQQKIRDLFLNWVRLFAHSSPAGANNSRGLSETCSTSLEILRQLHIGNYRWFAEIVAHEYEQLEHKTYHQSTSSKSKLEKLEERLTRLSVSGNPVVTFLEAVDSHLLATELQDMLVDRLGLLMQPIVDGTNRQEPRCSADMIRMVVLGKLLAVVSPKECSRLINPVVSFVRSSLLDAFAGGHLLAVCPWVTAWRSEAPDRDEIDALLLAVYERMPGKSPAVAALKMMLESAVIPSAKQSERPPPELPNPPAETSNLGPLFAVPLDQDTELLGLERVLKYCVPEFRIWLLELSQINMPLQGGLTARSPVVSTGTAQPVVSRPLRKLRPTTTTTDVETAESLLQRKLRQWFWWQHPGLRELSDAIIRYLQAELVEVEEAAGILWKVVPPLLPGSMLGSRQMSAFVICLMLEQIQPPP